MKAEYTKAEYIINKARFQLQKLLDEIQDNQTIEDHEAYSTLDNIIDKMTSAENEFEYLNSPTKEGILIFDNDTDKYYIDYDDGSTSCLLSCGSTLELFLDGEWIIGRVEARNGDYYFYGGDKPSLNYGMKARKRI